jgi:hypothetical protein
VGHAQPLEGRAMVAGGGVQQQADRQAVAGSDPAGQAMP